MSAKGVGKIDQWLALQSDEEQQAFRTYARRLYHNKAAIADYLAQRGCVVSAPTTYRWVGENVRPGDQALLFNAENQDYVGIEIIPALERIFTQMVKISRVFIDKIDQADLDRISLEQAIKCVPEYAQRISLLAQTISETISQRDAEALISAGASRMCELIMNHPNVRDSPEEDWIRRVVEGSVMQVLEESQKKGT